MGLFDFVVDVGKALFGGGEPETPEDHAQALKKELDSMELGTEGVEVEVEGDTAVLKGNVADQSIFEKAVLAVGNTLGVSHVKTDDVKVAAADAGEARMHTVQKGETLWGIAQEAYGNGAKYNEIFEANRPMLTHPDKIYPGQMLRLPPLD
jgi:nucleoid-associated protein YgaU